jgi:hypothetical protein
MTQTRYTRDPDRTGPAGTAWLVKAPEGGPPDWQGSIAAWIVNQPGAHPFWRYWFVGVVHLRDIPGVKPAKKRYPLAAYEFIILALDPEKPLPEIDGHRNGNPMKMLMPPDVVLQFHGLDDKRAEELAGLAVAAIINGQMSPDQDYRGMWRAAIQSTIEHLQGKHEGN